MKESMKDQDVIYAYLFNELTENNLAAKEQVKSEAFIEFKSLVSLKNRQQKNYLDPLQNKTKELLAVKHINNWTCYKNLCKKNRFILLFLKLLIKNCQGTCAISAQLKSFLQKLCDNETIVLKPEPNLTTKIDKTST